MSPGTGITHRDTLRTQCFGIKVNPNLLPFDAAVSYHLPATELFSKEAAQ